MEDLLKNSQILSNHPGLCSKRMSDYDSELQDIQLEASALSCRMRVLVKRMVKTGLTPHASKHMKTYKSLLDQQRAMIMAMQNDLDLCE